MPVDTEESEFLFTEPEVFPVNVFCKVFTLSGGDNSCEKEDMGGDDEDEVCHLCGLWWYEFYVSLMVCICII